MPSPTPTSLPQVAAPDPGVTLASLVHCAWRDRFLIGGIALALGTLVAATVLLLPRQYRSTATFIPSAARSASALAGVAAQLGVGLGGGDAAQSPAFYAALVRSRETLGTMAAETLSVAGASFSLADRWGADESTPALRLDAATRALEERVDVDVDVRTGLITLAVEAADAQLAFAIADRLLTIVNRFNLERRQSQAGAERQFAQERLVQVRRELAQAEARLQGFLARNRAVPNASPLRFEADRLEREVTVRRGVLDALSQSYEQARLDEVRDTPVITVVERPAVALRPAPRGLVAKTAIAMFLGTLLGLAWSWGRDTWRRMIAHAPAARTGDHPFDVPATRQAA